ncbi:hypothetical protein MJN85_27465, partial [Salmonella enterica subsp. enterica serovar Anatum]|nr:hypothetical protein [Salmonella enterica subsp. enterica serovar Anatum]
QSLGLTDRTDAEQSISGGARYLEDMMAKVPETVPEDERIWFASTFLPVIDDPQKIICVGMNYADKRIEFNETNPAPTLFVRFADS